MNVDEATQIYFKSRTCTNKRSYGSRTKAKKVAREQSTRLRDKLRAYKCTYCLGYHIGHNKYK